MGLFAHFRAAFHLGHPRQRGRTEAASATTRPGPLIPRNHPSPREGTPRCVPGHASIDELAQGTETAGPQVHSVDPDLDAIREGASNTAHHVDVSVQAVVDLTSLDSVRTRIKGSAHYVTDAERRRYGGRDYLLIREPDNTVDSSAIAVYGRGRKVGHLSAARAASLAPLLDRLGAAAYRVTGTGTSSNSIVLWVDVPKAAALRKFVQARA